MEIFSTVIWIILFAFIITAAFSFIFRSSGPWGSSWTFFLVIFLFLWAGSVWLVPVGPVYSGVSWVPLLFLGILMALLLIAATPPHYRRKNRGLKNKSEMPDEAYAAVVALDIFFWLAVVILIVAIIAGAFN